MITTLLELAEDLLQLYKSYGPSVLTKTPFCPQFHRLANHLSKITLDHVGINNDNLKDYFKEGGISFINIFEDQDICVGVFCLGKGSFLDLHDHPNMLVMTKYLMGSVQYRSLDLVDKSQQIKLPTLLYQDERTDIIGTQLEATVRTEKVIKAGEISYLTPDNGNIHKFTALENTAFLDILLPNYNETDRYCNYYVEVPFGEESKEQFTCNMEMEPNQEQKNNSEESSEDYRAHASKTVKMSAVGMSSSTEPKSKQPGDKTTLVYTLPPFDQVINLLPYRGEKFEYQVERSDLTKEDPQKI